MSESTPQGLRAFAGHPWSWARDVLGRKDMNDKVPGLVILETVPGLPMRGFLFSAHLHRAFPGASRASR